MTPTALRKNLFLTLRRVMRGETVVIETQEGQALLSRDTLASTPRKKRQDALKPKISGRIIGSLDTADAELRKYLSLPY